MTAFDHLKTPLAKSLNTFAKGKAQSSLWSVGKGYPCTVSKVISSGIVQVNFEVNADPWTLPQITVPVEYPEYIRYPIQVGDKGLCIAASARLGGITGLGSGVPDLSMPGNLAALSFVWLGNTAWVAPLDPDAVEVYGVGNSGVILRSGDSNTVITIKGDSVAITLGGPCTIESNGNDITVNGGGDVIADGVSLINHVHSGVQTGSGDTGPPT